jgi:Right handed beta helix region
MNQLLSNRIILPVLVFAVSTLFPSAGRLQAREISGDISTTLTLFEDSELVGDVTCMVAGAPCIALGAPGIKLRLNGFKITEETAGCTPGTSSQDGIDVAGLHDVAVLGPGLVQKFGGFGIGIFGSSKVRVEGITASDNCFSGIILVGTTDSDIERNVSVRNSMGSEGAPCGGT